MDFTNKVVLLTGGAIGIGFEYAKELLRNGVKHLAILDLPTSSGAETADKLNGEFRNARVIFIVCDVTNDNEFEAAFAKTVKEFGGLDIVINNAGILNEKKWKLMIDINVTAVVKGTMLGLQYMGKDQGGKGGIIVNTASIFGLDPVEWFPIYDATKFAVIGLSRSFGLPYHYEKTGVTVLAMCPGVTDTALAAGAGNGLGSYVDPKLAIDGYRKFPLHKPEVVGKALVEIIRKGKSGSVWISEGGKPVTEVFIPDRFELIASSRKYLNFVHLLEMDFKNKVAMITGGANGIGFECVKELLRSGVEHVAILDLITSRGVESADKLNAEFGKGRTMFIVCDVTKTDEFEVAFSKTIVEFGRLDIVINNAGILKETKWELMIDINFMGVVRGTMLGLRHMGKNTGGIGGVIVNIASIFGLDPVAWFPVYDATKHAVIGLSRSFGLPYHYEKTGVRVLTMCPGITETSLVTNISKSVGEFGDAKSAEEDMLRFSKQNPEVVAKATMEIIQKGTPGSVWLSEGEEPVCNIIIPDRLTLVAFSRAQEYTQVVNNQNLKTVLKWFIGCVVERTRRIDIIYCSEMNLKDKVALVTGSARGTGFAHAMELLRNGVKHVAMLDLATSPGTESANKLNMEFGQGRAIFVICDVTKADEFEAAFAKTVKEFGGIDIVINNAGILNESNWKLMINVDLNAVVQGTMLGMKYMGKNSGGKGGVIVNISSAAGIDPSAWYPVYVAAKHGVIGLTRSFGLPYHHEKTGVRIMALCPGVVTDTAMGEDGGHDLGPFVDYELALKDIRTQSIQKPEVVAKALVEIIQQGRSGSVWISEGEESVTEVFIPDRFTLIASSRKQHYSDI
nr:uncharacterized protein LOC124223733 [Neodiprion pinetum]